MAYISFVYAFCLLQMFAATRITTHKILKKQFFHGANTNASQSNVASKEVDTKKLLTLAPSRHVLIPLDQIKNQKRYYYRISNLHRLAQEQPPKGEDQE